MLSITRQSAQPTLIQLQFTLTNIGTNQIDLISNKLQIQNKLQINLQNLDSASTYTLALKSEIQQSFLLNPQKQNQIQFSDLLIVFTPRSFSPFSYLYSKSHLIFNQSNIIQKTQPFLVTKQVQIPLNSNGTLYLNFNDEFWIKESVKILGTYINQTTRLEASSNNSNNSYQGLNLKTNLNQIKFSAEMRILICSLTDFFVKEAETSESVKIQKYLMTGSGTEEDKVLFVNFIQILKEKELIVQNVNVNEQTGTFTLQSPIQIQNIRTEEIEEDNKLLNYVLNKNENNKQNETVILLDQKIKQLIKEKQNSLLEKQINQNEILSIIQSNNINQGSGSNTTNKTSNTSRNTQKYTRKYIPVNNDNSLSFSKSSDKSLMQSKEITILSDPISDRIIIPPYTETSCQTICSNHISTQTESITVDQITQCPEIKVVKPNQQRIPNQNVKTNAQIQKQYAKTKTEISKATLNSTKQPSSRIPVKNAVKK
ncbi:Conserved_hypothetical protein [Hexamita inflata]|uniref:Uncharacterized protein n=1 Tax=Hexamita inflata TaxID=28002 RepID=A0AA86RTM5_9EUKA|nr:Conserved hypothetical protein [Hexamita inflata]